MLQVTAAIKAAELEAQQVQRKVAKEDKRLEDASKALELQRQTAAQAEQGLAAQIAALDLSRSMPMTTFPAAAGHEVPNKKNSLSLCRSQVVSKQKELLAWQQKTTATQAQVEDGANHVHDLDLKMQQLDALCKARHLVYKTLNAFCNLTLPAA